MVGDRIPVGGEFFFAFVQTGRWAHPTPCTMGTGSFPRVKQPGSGVDHPLLCSAEIKEWVKLYFSLSGPLWPLPSNFSTVHPCTFRWMFTTYSVCREGSYEDKAANLYSCFFFFDVLLTVQLNIFILVINQLDAQNFCFTISAVPCTGCARDGHL